ncbi:hypothetical protein IVA79_08250 [Bradyrhizobium sp. 138]|uniref:hypothetical protein n=1 Tax=Bradyrhizobium sp. 138 TaxID=2782615 RepID=UPI001FF9AE18|nr:hypothetical protein [Bradyrhizobium sp. 138]MCK1733945.1 hypothetical protein [Bradyrhizobium sp. 138]
MRGVAEILERKRELLDRRQEAGPARFAAVERELEEIDALLTRLESGGSIYRPAVVSLWPESKTTH